MSAVNSGKTFNDLDNDLNIKETMEAEGTPEVVDLTLDDDEDCIMTSDATAQTQVLDELMDCSNDESGSFDGIEIVEMKQKDKNTEQRELNYAEAEECKRKGNAHFKNKEFSKALELYTRAIELTSTSPLASFYGNRSACYMMMKDYKQALHDVRRSLELNPTYGKGYLRLIKISLALGNVKECKMAFETAAEKGIKVNAEPELDELRKLKRLKTDIAYCRAKMDHKKLITLVSQALETATDDNSLKLAKADALIRLGKHLDAKDIATNVIKEDKYCVEAIHILATCLYQEDDLEGALQILRQLLQYAPDSEPHKLFLRKTKKLFELRKAGREKFESKDFDGAAKNYEKCLALVQSDEILNIAIESKIYFNLALVTYFRNEKDLSLNYCTKAITLNYKYVKAIAHRAKLYHEMKMFDDALRDYDAALKLDPTNWSLQNARLVAKKSSRKDFYTILGVNKNATEDDIRKAYKKRALLHHPDRHASAPEAVQKQQEKLFKDLREAYEVLTDPFKKSKYDQQVRLDWMEERLRESSQSKFSSYSLFDENGFPSYRLYSGNSGRHRFYSTYKC